MYIDESLTVILQSALTAVEGKGRSRPRIALFKVTIIIEAVDSSAEV